MMEEKSLLEERLLSSPAFMRDFKSFVTLPVEALLAIAELGNEPEGFVGRPQALGLVSRFKIPMDKTLRDLRVAEYLYSRVSELELDTAAAVEQVASVSAGLEGKLELSLEQRDAIARILSFKRAYEMSAARKAPLAGVPHFAGLGGSWSVKLVRTREGETVKVPVLTTGISWHDGVLNHHQAFFCLSERDWSEFTRQVQSFAEGHKDIDELL